MDIVIYTKPEVLLHKMRPDHLCEWTLRYHPKKLKIGDKIWFAVEQMIRGYFICCSFDYDSDEKPTIEFKSDSWTWFDEYKMKMWEYIKQFQGFKYMTKEQYK